MQYFVSEKLSYGTCITYTLLIIFLWNCSSALIEEGLPDSLVPLEYDLLINLNLNAKSENQFHWGQVNITVLCTIESNSITIDRINLAIKTDSLKVWNADTENDFISVIDENINQEDQYVITLGKNLTKNQKYVIRIEFFSQGDSAGFVNRDGSITHTEPDKRISRNAIPCLNRNNLKAKFRIQFGHQTRVKGFSNYELEGQTNGPEPDWVIDRFATPEVRMSASSFIIATSSSPCQEFLATSSTIRIQVCSNQEYLMKYVGNKVAAVFSYISKYITVPYPLSKFDLIVRDTLDSKIKEGFGLVVIDMEYLFTIVEPEPIDIINNPSIEYAVLSRICYVISHQWFGHMVTMIGEENSFHSGLNRFIQWQCVADEYYKYNRSEHLPIHEWDIISSFLYILKKEENEEWLSIQTQNPNLAFEPDAQDMELKVAHLIRMFYFSMRSKVFWRMLNDYLETFKFKNPRLYQVWDSFAMTEDEKTVFPKSLDTKKFMSDWLYRNGHPLITIKRNYGTSEITLEQELFINIPQHLKRYEKQYRCWTVPLSYATPSDTNNVEVKILIWDICNDDFSKDRVGRYTIKGLDKNQWLMVNMELNVPCRVNYDQTNWDLIKNDFFLNVDQYPSISVLTRVHLISDMFNMAKTARLDYKFVFETMKYLCKEKGYAVWKVVIDELHEIRSRLLGTNLHERFENYMRSLLKPVFMEMKDTEYSFTEANPSELKLSVLIMEQACTFGVKYCIQLGSNIIKQGQDFEETSANRIPYSINKAIHCQHVKKSNAHRDHLWNQYLTGTYSNEVKKGILESLGCSRSPDDLTSYLKSSLTTEGISNEDRLLIFKSLSSNVNGYSIMKTFLEKNYGVLRKHHKTSTDMIPYWQVIFDATSSLNELRELSTFVLKRTMIKEDDENMKRSKSNGKKNIEWLHYWEGKLDKLLGFKYRYNINFFD